MSAKDLQTLELPKVLERLAGFAAFSASKELAVGLTPTVDLEEARRRQAETSEARRLLDANPDLSIGGARDVRPQVVGAARGVVLEPSELLDLKATLISARKLGKAFERMSEEFPVLSAIAAVLQPIPGLIESISKTLNDRGEVLDTASKKLSATRSELQVVHDRLMGRLQRLVSDPKVGPLLQEPIITQREDRYVVPLRAEFKGRLKAVVHDQSGSGATLFVEPLQVVELNNRMRELKLEERDEIRRILAALTEAVGREEPSIRATVEALAQLDLAFAKASYAEQKGAIEPDLKPFRTETAVEHPGSTLKLWSARHPLLEPGSVVPIDLVLEDDHFALVITGPNTGGKTVALKTAGLLVLMAGCGMHIPCEAGSQLSLFDGVYADIGDEQSLEQSLSTFSAHIANIIRILKHADSRSLVLLDELGAGTDPQEGSALARAILGTLLERRVTTLVATHYPELKAYAHVTSGVRNASVEFDLESLKPTYHLTIGLPGRSNALAIAERLGLVREVVERARSALKPEDLQAEGLLDEIRRQRDAAVEARASAEAARNEAQAIREELAERLEGLEAERHQVLSSAREKGEAEVEDLRREIKRLRGRLAAASQPLEALEDLQREVDKLGERVGEPVARRQPEIRVESAPIRLGDKVQVRTLDMEGVVTDLGTEEAEVQIGRLRVRARLDDLLHKSSAQPETRPERPKAGRRRRSARMPDAPPIEIDLRGKAVDEALEAIERRLDAAYLAGLPSLRVIHGKGTGRLREAIRAQLEGNPYVAEYGAGSPAEGGEGVTIIRLANK